MGTTGNNAKSIKWRLHITGVDNSPSSFSKSTRCEETKVGLNGEALQEECLETRRTKKKAA